MSRVDVLYGMDVQQRDALPHDGLRPGAAVPPAPSPS